MIRTLVVDDHPALRAGVTTVLRAEPGIVPIANASNAAEAMDAMKVGVDVALVDYDLPDLDGLQLCHRLKRLDRPPRVLIYSAHAHDRLAIPARLAGADGMLDKGVDADVLFDAIRVVARGGEVFPPLRLDLMEAANAVVDTADLPIIGMVFDGTSRAEIAEALRIDPQEVDERVTRMIEALRPRVSGDAP